MILYIPVNETKLQDIHVTKETDGLKNRARRPPKLGNTQPRKVKQATDVQNLEQAHELKISCM